MFFNQSGGIGDIIFLEPVSRFFYTLGHSVYWKVYDVFYEDLVRHIPYVNWVVDCDSIPPTKTLDFEHARFQGMRILESKYNLVGLPLESWRSLSYLRDFTRERTLFEELNLKPHDRYCLRQLRYGSKSDVNSGTHGVEIQDSQEMRTIDLNPIDGFSLFDWSGVIQNSSEIKVVSTSSLFLIETLHLVNNPTLDLYARETDPSISETSYLCKKGWKFHRIGDTKWET